MSQAFGIAAPAAHANTSPRPAARYLVVIDAGGYAVARLFLATREQVAEFDASTEEVAQMVGRLPYDASAGEPAWDRALAGHSAEERAQARVYVLDH